MRRQPHNEREAQVAGRTFDSVEQLYDCRGGRRSPECDLGVWWRASDRPGPYFRLTWVEETGDLYLFSFETGVVTVIATIPPEGFPEDEHERYKSLDRDESRPLNGWWEHCGSAGGLDWVLERVRPWPPTSPLR